MEDPDVSTKKTVATQCLKAMDTLYDLLAPSMSISDPFLGSPWVNQDFDLDYPALESSNLDNAHHDVQTNPEGVSSPSHGLDQLMGLQPDSPVVTNLLQDWGALDDMLYRKQIEQGPRSPLDEEPMDADYETIHSPMSSMPGTASGPGSFSAASSSMGLLSSSLRSSLLELQSFENISITSLDPLWKRPQPTLSRSGSTSSVQSERGRTRLKDKHNVQRLHQRDTSAFYEHIFDSDPTRSTSRASASSGCRGPLDMEARATMIAVKEIGACWRCKTMRKSCNADTPCDACPNLPRSSHWRAVGCKRGALKNQMPRILLCPKTDDKLRRTAIGAKDATCIENEWVLANMYMEDITRRRNREISNAIQTAETWSDKVNSLLTTLRSDIQETIDAGALSNDSTNLPSFPTSNPLEDTILAIVWELSGSAESQTLLSNWVNPQAEALHNFVSLLSSAAAYEVKSNNRDDDLITQSLSCLLRCLEALRLQASDHFGKASHQVCEPSVCRVECIQTLTLSLELCADRICASIFKREILRSEAWWMSTFYSLCLQSVVRRCLMVLERESTDPGHRISHSHEHFRLAFRLFTALSGSFDPLNQDLSTEFQSSAYEMSRIEELKAAQVVVNQHKWPEMGLTCSGDYLRHLFDDFEPSQDSGKAQVARRELGTAGFTILPEPYLPDIFDIESYRKLRADRDLAGCNYTKHVVLIGARHGWDSEVYTLIEDKWASVDAIWKKHSQIALENILKHGEEARTPNPHEIGTKYDIGLDAFLERNGEKGKGKHFPETAIYASLRQNPNPREMAQADNGAYPEKQSPRFAGDMYWPRWIRGQESSREEGWCGMCIPGRWLPLDGAFQDDKDFKHGVSAVTGKPFAEPKEMRRMKSNPTILWGLCGTCGDWVEILGSKEGEIAWFVHSFGCYI